jgi:ABC-type antimicrobial peptide transport system permease subunit
MFVTCHELAGFLYKHSDEYHILLMSPHWHSLQHTKICLLMKWRAPWQVDCCLLQSPLLHSSWRASDDARFIVLTSLVKSDMLKNFMRCAIFCLACKQEIAFHRIVPKMLTSCPCDGRLSKNVISQSDRSTRAMCDIARVPG